MVETVNEIEILMIEDNPNDAELSIRALMKNNLANKLVWLKDAMDVLRRIKSDERTKTIPVVVLTYRDVVESYQFGVNSNISKPMEFDEFVRTVSEQGLYWPLMSQALLGTWFQADCPSENLVKAENILDAGATLAALCWSYSIVNRTHGDDCGTAYLEN